MAILSCENEDYMGDEMNIYTQIKEANADNLEKLALSIFMDSGVNKNSTYASLFESVDTASTELIKLGFEAGDRVAIVAENSPEWVITYLALMIIKCTAALIDASLSPEEIKGLLENCDVIAVATSPKMLHKVESMKENTLLLNVFDISVPFVENSSINRTDKQLADRDENIANIIFSSGTTRTAAGIMHTHEALVLSTQMCLNQINMKKNEERFLAILPCSHIYGIVCTLIGPLLIGAEVRFLESLTSDAILGVFAEYKPTIFPAVPKMLELFSSQITRKISSDKKTKTMFNLFFPICYFLREKFGVNLGKKLFGSIHEGFGGAMDIICSAGAPIDKATADFYYGCGLNVLITYGATETNIPTLGNLRHNITTDTCGSAYPDVQVELSEEGELLIKSPYMMQGYFRNEEASEQAFEDGWFMTGDTGFIDEKGFYHITGRVKDNIVLATGKKVTPDDVEMQYNGITGVKEMVVCGIPVVAGGGDEIHAFIVLEENGVQADVSKAIQDIGGALSTSMKISQIHFVDSIPRTSLQKPKRYLLKKAVLENDTQVVAESSKEDENSEATIISIIAQVAKVDRETIDLSSKPFSQLGIDSLSSIDLILQIEDKFNVRIDESLTKEVTVSDILELIETKQAIGAEKPQGWANFASLYPVQKRLGDYKLFRRVCGWARMLYKVNIKGEDVLPVDSGYIICSNHISNLDYLWLSINFGKERFLKFCCMAKKELFGNSLFSKSFSRIFGMIPVDRGGFNVDLMQLCKEKLSEKWGLLIYPEGTRSSDGKLATLKNGAAQLAIESNVPIIPAYINGAYEIYPKSKKLPSIFNFKKMQKYPVEVLYGEPIYPEGLSAENLTALIEDSIRSLSTVVS